MADFLWYAAAAGFEAARSIDAASPRSRSGRLHGHSFLVRVRADLPAAWPEFPGAEADSLKARLGACLAPLDYQFVNRYLRLPTDENIALWIRSRLEVPGVQALGLQSGADAGVELDRDGNARIWRRYRFESAHRLPNVPRGHKCGRLHGHGFEVVVHAQRNDGGDAAPTEYEQLDESWALLQPQLDHTYLNDIPGLENPTSECLTKWIWDQLRNGCPRLTAVTVKETAGCGAQFDGARYRIWKDLSLDCAVRLQRAPAGDRRRSIHGHTYTLRLHLGAPLDRVLGWVADFGDVKALFKPLLQRLDHQPLHEIDGIADFDAGSLARYIRSETAALLPSLDRIDLFSTPGCGALLAWSASGPSALV